MTDNPSGSDVTFHTLNQLVTAGQLTPQQAQAAYDAAHPPVAAAPWFAESKVPRWLRPDVLLVLVGCSLLFGTVALSTWWSREDGGDLDWGIYSTGLVATAVLLAGAAVAWFLVRDPDRRAVLMSWPGVLGAIGVGQMISTGLEDNDFVFYFAGAAIAVLCAVGYWLVRQPAYVVGAIVGIFMLYVQIFDDTYGVDEIEGDNFGIALGLVVLVFTLMVTAAGWFLPTRDLSAIIVGAFAVAAYTLTLISLATATALANAFNEYDPEGVGTEEPDNPYVNDVWFLVLFASLLCALWALAWWLRGHDGYRVLVLVMVTGLIPAATVALATEHAARWGVVLIAVGGLGLVLAVLRSLGLVGAPNQRSDVGATG